MNKIIYILVVILLSFWAYGNTQQTHKNYLFISYSQSEEYFPNPMFFVPLDYVFENEHQLFTKLNDTINRIYYDIDYFILHNKDSVDYIESFIDSIIGDSSSIIYSSKENNLIIHLIKTKGELEKYYWNQQSPTSIPYFIFNKSCLKRTFINTQGRQVLQNVR